MPLMGLSGLWPLLVHCQLFGAPSIPFPNYAQSPFGGLFSLLGFGNYPHMPPNAGSYPPPFAPYPRSDPPFYQSPYQPPPPPPPPPAQSVEYSSRYMPPPPMPYSYSSNNVVLPKLPTKYDIGIFKSAPNMDKSNNYPNSYYSYKYEPYPMDPMVYPTKPLHDKSGSYYKSVYPKSPYGNYRELLKALLSGPPSAYMPSYSQNVPSIKNLLEGDYASILGKSPAAATAYLEKPEYPYPTEFAVSEQKAMYPVGAPAEKPVAPDVREMYAKQFPDLVAYNYQKPLQPAQAQKPTFVYAAEPDRMPAVLSAQTTNPYALTGLSSPYAEKKAQLQQEGPVFYQEKMAGGYPDMKTFYQLSNAFEKKPLTYDQLPSITLKIPYQSEQQQQRMTPGSGYDLYPMFSNVGLKQPNAYPSLTAPAPGQDITYETDNVPSKPANYPTYFTATKQAEYKRDPGNVEKKAPPQMDESYAPARYPTLGYEMDREQRKPVPAIIAALFGGGKLGKSIDTASGEQYGPKANYETSSGKQGYFSAPVTGYEENQAVKQVVTGQNSGRYQQSAANNSPVDIFIPIGRTSKHTGTDPIKTIMH